jgi:pimeloyl-ACP methyl ester carboxylesterase
MNQLHRMVSGLTKGSRVDSDRRSTLSYVPRARIVEIDDAGHFPELEQPAKFRDELLGFLDTM